MRLAVLDACIALCGCNKALAPLGVTHHDVPGFIMTEAMVQMFVLTTQYETKYSGEKVNDLQFQNVRFLKKLYPGDCLELKSTVTYHKRGIVKGETHGYCEGEIACSMEITLAVLSELEKVQPKKI